LCSFGAYAIAQESLPANCGSDGFSVRDKLIFFNTDYSTHHIFILHNVSKGIVMLSHNNLGSGVSAGWQSKLDKDKWAAIAVNTAGFSLGCMLYNPPNIGQADCASVVSVCSMTNTSSVGPSWLAENTTLSKVLEALHARGL
jgi:hypothetical protein